MIDKNSLKKLRQETNAGYADCKQALLNTSSYEEAVQWLRKHGAAKAVKKMNNEASDGVISLKFLNNKALMMEINTQTDFVAKNAVFTDFVNKLTDLVFDSNAKTIEEIKNLKFNSKGTVEQEILNLISVVGENISLRRAAVISAPKVGGYLHTNKRIGVIVAAESGEPLQLKQVAMHVAALAPTFIDETKIDEKWRAREMEVIYAQMKNENKPEKFINKIAEGKYQKVLSENVLIHQNFILDAKLKVSDFLQKNGIKLVEVIRFEVGA